ncbi:sodium:proton antiporter, partial [Streptococcus suis]
IALYQANTALVLEALQNLDDVYSADLVGYLIHSRKQEAQIIQSGAFVERVITRNIPDNVDEMLRGFYLERKVIAEYEAEDLISRRYAKALRKEVNALENYSLKETVNTLSYDLFNYT